MFSSFIENPFNIHFENQDISEKIILLLRAHPITNFSWIIPALFFFFLPFFLPDFIALVGFEIINLPTSYLTTLLIINYLLVLVISFEGFLHWYFNVNIVTDKNMVDIDFHSILFKNIDLAPLRNIEEVNSSMGGILRAIFNYGDVFIQTAGAVQTVDLHAVPNPHRVADIILDQAHLIQGKNNADN